MMLRLQRPAQFGGAFVERTGYDDDLNGRIGEQFFDIVDDPRPHARSVQYGKRCISCANGDEFMPPRGDESQGGARAVGMIAEKCETHADSSMVRA